MANNIQTTSHEYLPPKIFSNMMPSGATSQDTNIAENDFFCDEWCYTDFLSNPDVVKTPSQRMRKIADDRRYTIDTVGRYIENFSTLSTEPSTPFEQLFIFESDQRKHSIENVKNIPHPYAEKVYHRLKNLEKASEEEYPNTQLISVDSLYGFKKFLNEFERLNLKYPDVTLTPLGNIRMQWQKNKDYYLSVEFTSNQEVKIVLFTPDSNIKGKIIRLAVKMPIVSTFDNLQPYKVLTWITE